MELSYPLWAQVRLSETIAICLSAGNEFLGADAPLEDVAVKESEASCGSARGRSLCPNRRRRSSVSCSSCRLLILLAIDVDVCSSPPLIRSCPLFLPQSATLTAMRPWPEGLGAAP